MNLEVSRGKQKLEPLTQSLSLARCADPWAEVCGRDCSAFIKTWGFPSTQLDYIAQPPLQPAALFHSPSNWGKWGCSFQISAIKHPHMHSFSLLNKSVCKIKIWITPRMWRGELHNTSRGGQAYWRHVQYCVVSTIEVHRKYNRNLSNHRKIIWEDDNTAESWKTKRLWIRISWKGTTLERQQTGHISLHLILL